MNFEINLIFLIQLFFPTRPKSQCKNLNIFRTKRALKMKQKVFFVIFNGNVIFLREGKIPTLNMIFPDE